MAISLKTAGTWARNVSDPTGAITIPGSPAAGDRMFLFATWKTYSITTASISGWTAIGSEFADGTSNSGNGTGSVKVMAWYRDWQSGDSGPSIDWSSAPSEAHVVIQLWQKAAGDVWATPKTVTAAMTNWTTSSQTVSASSTTDIESGAVVMGLIGIRDDSATMTRPTDGVGGSGVTWNGNYVESPATHFSSTTGDDMSGDLGHRFITTGGSGITLTMTGTISASETGAAKWVVQEVNPTLSVSKSDSVTVTEGPSGGSTTATYYIDGSDAGATDPNTVWTNDAEAFNNDTTTAATTSTNGSTASNFLKAEGTNAPSVGGGITQVRARIYANAVTITNSVNAAIYTDGLAELLGTATKTGSVGYGSYTTLSAPSGGWTWAQVAALETKAYFTLDTANTVSLYIVEFEVTYSIATALLSIQSTVNKSDSITASDSIQGYSDTVYVNEGLTVSIETPSSDPSVNKSDTATVTENVSVFIPELFGSVSDTVTITESVARLVENYVSTSDSATLTEALNLLTTNNVSVSDTATITENLKLEPENRVSVSDSVTITENRSLLIPELFASVSDSVTVSEALQRLVENRIAVSDSVNVTENVQRLVENYINTSDSVTVTEALQRLVENRISVNDTATITEAVTLLVESYINKSDTVTLTENVEVTIPVVSEYSVNVSDNVTVTESLKLEPENRVSVSDSITITENVQRLVENYVGVSDSVTITEAIQRMAENRVNVSDTITVTENILREANNRVSVSDGVTISESVTVFIPELHINVSDSITLSESQSVNIASAGEENILESESVTVSESVSILIPELKVNVSDTATITESVAVSRQNAADRDISVADTATISESIKLEPLNFVNVSDSVTVSEFVTSETVNRVSVSDTISITEAIQREVVSRVEVNDTVSITEFVASLIPELKVSVSDSITITESKSISVEGVVNLRKYYIDTNGNIYWVINQDLGLVEKV